MEPMIQPRTMTAHANTSVCARHLAQTPHIHRLGRLDVRIATSEEEVAAAQALRYRIFCGEMGASAGPQARALARDIDPYDPICDHLLVIDHGEDGRPQVVGTYRLLRQVVASMHQGFYSAGEYDLGTLIAGGAGPGQLLELGRSCVAPEWRNSTTITLLWRGIASYLTTHGISAMFGCASLHGTDPADHAAELSYLYHQHLAPPALRARALQHVPMDRLPVGSYDSRAAQRALPPLVKGYLRVGAMVGDGAFVDREFNTVDVFVIMPVEGITRRYLDRFTGANDPG
jgi:putative hemolysin